MAIKKTGKTEAVKGKGVVKVHTLEITPEQLMNGINRFAKVCDFVERQMPTSQTQEELYPAPRQLAPQAPSAPKPTPSVEQMAGEMRSVAEDIAKQASAIRERLTMGANTPDEASAGNAVASQGPLKDYVDGTMHFLYSIRRDLDTINQYAIG